MLLQSKKVSHSLYTRGATVAPGLCEVRKSWAHHCQSMDKCNVSPDQVGRSSQAAKRHGWKARKVTNSDIPASGQAHAESTRTAKAPSNTNEAMKADVNKIRGYLDLLDDYSLHHFIIWQGKTIRDTPEFTSLARTHQASWSSIDRCVSILEEIMAINAVPLAVIDGKQLGELARSAPCFATQGSFPTVHPQHNLLRLPSRLSLADSWCALGSSY